MIVTARARYGHSLEGLGKSVDLIVDDIGPEFAELNAVVVAHLAEAEERGTHDRFVPFAVVASARLVEKIAGDVFANKLIVGDIAVEGANQIVAIAPRTANFVVPFVAVGFGVANHIHPVARPFFSKVRRREQMVDIRFVGCWME